MERTKASRALDRLSLLLLGLAIFMLVCYGLIYISPNVIFNPFKPYELAMSTLAPTPTIGPTQPPTWTPTRSKTS